MYNFTLHVCVRGVCATPQMSVWSFDSVELSEGSRHF